MHADIVMRLRTTAWLKGSYTGDLLHEAADEIERLRAAGDALVAAIRNHDLREEHIKAWEEACRG